jgi:hypothetical protein
MVSANPQSGVPMVRGLFRYLTKAPTKLWDPTKTHQSRRCLTECLCNAECGTWLCELFLRKQTPSTLNLECRWSEGSFDTSRKRQRSCGIQQDAPIDELSDTVPVQCRMRDLAM